MTNTGPAANDRATTRPRLAELTTLRVGGPVAGYVETHSEDELVTAVRSADEAGTPLLVLGGGSNLLVADSGFDGVVVRDMRRGIEATDVSGCAGASVRIPAGQPWEDVVARAVAEGWSGIEALSGIPGSTGATPVQNVGAYGQEISQTLAAVRVWDRGTGRLRSLTVSELGLGYRSSVLKRSLVADDDGRAWRPTPRYVVLEVELQLPLGQLSAPVRYAELARRLDVEVGERVPAHEARKAVLELRGGKGMVLDAADHDSWSAGSFFTNPVLDPVSAARLPREAPRFPVVDHTSPAGASVPGAVKTSAAWLISHAGFAKGHGMPGPAALSTKHSLALTNRGGARAADVLALAREVRDGVAEHFGIELVPEPVLVGLRL